MAEGRSLLKNEATDLLDNKGSALGEIRNEATVGVSYISLQFSVFSSRCLHFERRGTGNSKLKTDG
jgi:hypothetical protein